MSAATKPNARSIREAPRLSRVPLSSDRLAACNVCGLPSARLRAWRAHDERDRPIDGTDALVFVGTDHPTCSKAVDSHPRLFAHVTGAAGHFPLVCGPCTKRDGLTCGDPRAKSNGGAGIKVGLDHMAMVVCIKTAKGSVRPVPEALTCEGQNVKP